LGAAFGVSRSESFIVSGSEDGDIVFWDVRNKEEVQRVSGHEGVVYWVDTSPVSGGSIASGGLDGTVRIWVDVDDEDDEAMGRMNGLQLEQDDEDMRDVKIEGDNGYDTPRDEDRMDGRRYRGRDRDRSRSRSRSRSNSPDRMDED
jgi:COMPASS component SWD3